MSQEAAPIATAVPSEPEQILSEKPTQTTTAPPPTTTILETASSSKPASISSPPAPAVAPQDFQTAEDEPGNVKTVPFAYPVASCTPAALPTLTAEQEQKYSDLLDYCQAITEIPTTTAKGAPTAPLSESERMWLTKECLLRYLRATKWILADAKKRVEGTLVWRREYGVEKLTSDYIEIENRTGKQVIMGFDQSARPCLYLNPAKQNTEKSNRQVEHLVYALERVTEIAPPGQGTLALLVNFASANSGKVPAIGQGREVLNILQTHYPERLGRALVINIPWFVWGFFKLITPFIDPLTREKLIFNEALSNHVPPAQLLKEFGGEVEFEYNHDVYWPNLTALAAHRKELMLNKWKANGSKIGETEDLLKEDFHPPGATATSTAAPPAAESSMEQVTDGVSKVAV